MKSSLRNTISRLLQLPALRAGFGLVVLIILAMANIGMTALALLALRLTADVGYWIRKGTVPRLVIHETLASALLLGIAAILAVFLDGSLHPSHPAMFDLASVGFRLACSWAVLKALWRHPLWNSYAAKQQLHWSVGLSAGALAAALLLFFSPLWGIATETVLAAIITHLTPSAW